MIDFPTPSERRAEAQRLLEGLNGQWVAERMGFHKNTINFWRSGKRIPNLENLLRLAAATGRPLASDLQQRLFGADPPPEKDALAAG